MECLLRDEFALEGLFSEEDIKAYLKKDYPCLLINGIKTNVNKDLSIQAIIYSNELSILNGNSEKQ